MKNKNVIWFCPLQYDVYSATRFAEVSGEVMEMRTKYEYTVRKRKTYSQNFRVCTILVQSRPKDRFRIF
jgi:hypothetical protein